MSSLQILAESWLIVEGGGGGGSERKKKAALKIMDNKGSPPSSGRFMEFNSLIQIISQCRKFNAIKRTLIIGAHYFLNQRSLEGALHLCFACRVQWRRPKSGALFLMMEYIYDER